MAEDKIRYERIQVRTWFLRFNGEFSEFGKPETFQLWKNPLAEEYLKLYRQVGDVWGWTGRLLLSDEELQAKLNSVETEVWLFQPEGKTIGFFEIDFSTTGKAEIVYLGLIPTEIGKGHGRHFLNAAVAIAGRSGQEVWLHTCQYDHPGALNSYLKAGFEIIKEKVEEEYYPVHFLNK